MQQVKGSIPGCGFLGFAFCYFFACFKVLSARILAAFTQWTAWHMAARDQAAAARWERKVSVRKLSALNLPTDRRSLLLHL